MKTCRGGKDSQLLFINSDFDRTRENRYVKDPSPRIAAGFLFKHQISWSPSLCFGCTLPHFSKVVLQGTKICFEKSIARVTARERKASEETVVCTFKMGHCDLSKYSAYVDCVTMAYSAGNKNGQNPAEISITEMGTCTARAELIKRQNQN